MESTEQYSPAAGITETQNSTLAALEAMPDQELQAKAAGTAGNPQDSKRPGQTVNPAPEGKGEAKEQALNNIQRVFDIISGDDTALEAVKEMLLEMQPRKDGRDLSDDTENILDMIEGMEDEERITVTVKQLRKIEDFYFDTGKSCIVNDLLRFYSLFFPEESSTVFKMVQVIGYISEGEEIRKHREAIQEKG